MPDKKIIVFTHMPINCWSKNADYHKNFIYVSGHTHRADFYDNGDIRVYWAADTIYKKVYSSVPALLKQECPEIYERYTKLLQGSSNNLPILANYVCSDLDQPPQTYYGTEIYEFSREMNKMQRLNSNILTT